MCGGLRGRENANFEDLNRDFPKRLKFSGGVSNQEEMSVGRQIETIAMMNWIHNEPFVMVCAITKTYALFAEIL